MSPEQVARRVLVDAGLTDGGAKLERAVAALMGSRTQVKLSAQVEALARVLLGLSRGRRGLALTVEDAEHVDSATLEVIASLIATLLEDDQAVAGGGSKLFLLLAVRSREGVADEQMRGWVEEVPFVTHMEVGELPPEAARELAVRSSPGGRLPDDVLDYLVAHCEGVCLNIEQMTNAIIESELLFLTGDGVYELEGDIGKIALPTNLAESIRLRLAAVAERDPSLDLLLKLVAVMGGNMCLKARRAACSRPRLLTLLCPISGPSRATPTQTPSPRRPCHRRCRPRGRR